MHCYNSNMALRAPVLVRCPLLFMSVNRRCPASPSMFIYGATSAAMSLFLSVSCPPVLVRYPLLYVSEYPKSSSDVLVGSPHSWSPLHQVGGLWGRAGVLNPQPTAHPTKVGGLSTLLAGNPRTRWAGRGHVCVCAVSPPLWSQLRVLEGLTAKAKCFSCPPGPIGPPWGPFGHIFTPEGKLR